MTLTEALTDTDPGHLSTIAAAVMMDGLFLRTHHLLKTFWGGPDGWADRQLPDGTVIWTAPGGSVALV